LGHSLGELEIYEGTKDRPDVEGFSKKMILSTRQEIEELLALTNIGSIPMDVEWKDLASKIVQKFSVTNAQEHAAILVGMTVVRIKLMKTSDTEEMRSSMEELARDGIIRYIQSGVVADKEALFISLSKSDCTLNSATEILLAALRSG
jgi:hypothetical protein